MGMRADGTPYLILCKAGLMEEEVDENSYDGKDEMFGGNESDDA